MNLKVGIVGLANVGKSTLFNALLKKQQALVANYPFATIEPNIGIVPVPDERLGRLAETVEKEEGIKPPEVHATVEFVDIAGLISGAHKGEGLGNQFLSHIREVDAICHVVRNFKDENIIREGSFDPKKDFEVIETELLLADLQTLEKQKSPGSTPDKEAKKKAPNVKTVSLPSNIELNISTCVYKFDNYSDFVSCKTKSGLKNKIIELKRMLNERVDFLDAETIDLQRRYDWLKSYYESL